MLLGLGVAGRVHPPQCLILPPGPPQLSTRRGRVLAQAMLAALHVTPWLSAPAHPAYARAGTEDPFLCPVL